VPTGGASLVVGAAAAGSALVTAGVTGAALHYGQLTAAMEELGGDAQSAGGNPYLGRSTETLLKSKASYDRLIVEHAAKIEAFKLDPIGNSSAEWLKQAMRDNPSAEVLLERAMGRIPALEKQLAKQQGELLKILEALK
jgi:hypothetical protein